MRELARECIAVRVASVRRIDVPEAADSPAIDKPLQDLIARIEGTVIHYARNGEFVWAAGLRVPQHAAQPVILVGFDVRPVVVSELDSVEQISRPHFR